MSDSASPPSTDDSSVNQPSADDNSSTSNDNNSPAPTESSPGLDDSPPVPIDAQLNGASPAPEGSSKSPPPEESPSPPPPTSSSLPRPSSSPPPPKSKSQPPSPPSPKGASPQSQSPPANSSPPSTPNASPPPPDSSSNSHVPSSSTPSPQKSQPRLQTDPLSNQSTPSPPADTTLPTPSSIPSNSTTLGDGSASNLPQNTPTQSLVPGQPSRVNSTANEKQPSSAINKAVSNTVTDSNNGGKIAGIIIGGVLILALIAVLFIVRRRKKKRTDPQYIVHNNYPHKADEYLYGQIPPTGHSGSPDSFYGVHTNAAAGNSYGSPQPYPVGGPESGLISSPKSIFNYKEVMEMTKGFSRQNVIGEGGFGCVFKGWLHDGKMVAVKQLKAGSGQGEREFKAEVEIISRVHHRHLVSLVGYCVAENQRLLIYDFVPNKTLEHHLHGKGLPVLDWTKRVKIALGAAKGLAYLHEDCHPKIIHRDIKSSNILLDDVFEAQVADFGLAKLTNDSKSHVSTRVMGTFGYMAPEYASSGKLTDRSDVFSFGVVLLELVTGRKPVDPTQPLGEESLVEWARPLLIHALETRDFSELVDPRLEKHYVESELFRMIEVAAASVRHSAPQRPRMAKVMRALDTEDDMLDLTNGVKYGQSIAYDSAQYSEDIMRFKRLALYSDNSSEFEAHGGEYTFRDVSQTPTSWKSEGMSSG